MLDDYLYTMLKSIFCMLKSMEVNIYDDFSHFYNAEVRVGNNLT